MPQALAYSELHNRNITLDEAHDLYFAQPQEARERFVFRCGDARCRAMLQPLVVGALYHKEDVPGAKRRSPYYRQHPAHAHIETCTWISDQPAPSDDMEQDPYGPLVSASALADLGLIFRINPPKANRKAGLSGFTLAGDPKTITSIDVSPDKDKGKPSRSETSKFMATVAGRHLKYTDEQRKNIPLAIEEKSAGTFYSLCMPIKGFHPHYQKERIYHGRAKITELDNVFFIRFLSKIDADGRRDQRHSTAEIKLLKRWLEENDRMLAEILHEAANAKSHAWCFFYTSIPTISKEKTVQFTVDDSAHIAIVPETEIRAVDPVQD